MASPNQLMTTAASTEPSSPAGGSHDFGGWLRRRRGVIFAGGAGVAIAALAWGQQWLAVAQLTPLLFLLPCALMMFMCMKNHGQRPDSGNGDTPAGGPTSG